MSAITKNNIVSGTEVRIALGPHTFQSTVTFRLDVSGKIEEVVRQSSIINCCTKIGTKHSWAMYGHKAAGTYNDISLLKSVLAKAENGKGHGLWTLVSRKLISPAPAPTAIVTAVPPPALANPLQLTVNNLQTQVSGLTNSNVALSTTVGVQNELIAALNAQAASLKTQIDVMNGTIETLRSQLAVIPALQQQITQLEGQVAILTQILGNILMSIQNGAL